MNTTINMMRYVEFVKQASFFHFFYEIVNCQDVELKGHLQLTNFMYWNNSLGAYSSLDLSLNVLVRPVESLQQRPCNHQIFEEPNVLLQFSRERVF